MTWLINLISKVGQRRLLVVTLAALGVVGTVVYLMG